MGRNKYDTMRVYRLAGDRGSELRPIDMTYEQYRRLPDDQKALHTPIRERINVAVIKGPLDTGWGYTDFDPQLADGRIGLPAFPGQVTN